MQKKAGTVPPQSACKQLSGVCSPRSQISRVFFGIDVVPVFWIRFGPDSKDPIGDKHVKSPLVVLDVS
jgi:hypothetical protein